MSCIFPAFCSDMTIMLWGNEVRFDAMERAIELYERTDGKVDIALEKGSYGDIWQKLQIMMNENSLPDIVAYDYKWMSELDDSLFVDIRGIDGIDRSSIPADILQDFSMKNGRMIGLPLGLNGIGLVYSKVFFERFGLDDPSSWDWNDIIENGRKVHEADPEAYLLFFPDSQWHYLFRTYILQESGHHIFSADGSIECTAEDLESVFSFILELIDTGTIPPFGQGTKFENWLPQWNEKWRKGEWGMTTASSSTIPDMATASPFPIATAPYPVPDNAIDSGVYAAPTMLLAISNASDSKEAAASFIDFLINDSRASRIISDSFGMPANVLNRREGNSLVYPMVEAALADAADYIYPEETSDELLEVISEYVHLVGFGIYTAEDAAQDMMKRLGAIASGQGFPAD